MCNPVGLQRQKAFEEQERLQHSPRRRVALDHGLHVCFGIIDQSRRAIIDSRQDMPHLLRPHARARELFRQMKGKRLPQRVMREDGGIEIARQRRLFCCSRLRLKSQSFPGRGRRANIRIFHSGCLSLSVLGVRWHRKSDVSIPFAYSAGC